jgi:hypothetical protein
MATGALIAGTLASIGSSYYQQKKGAKEQKRAAEAMASAMAKQPTVQAADVAAQQTQDTQASEQTVNTAAKRRFALSRTVNPAAAISSFSGTRKTL